MDRKSPYYYLNSASYFGWGENSKPDQERLRLIDRYTVGKSILDIGCGVGLYVDYVTSKGYEGTGVDFVSKFIDKAKETFRGNFIKDKIEKLPFWENQFDTSFLFDVLEHRDDVKLLKEAKRVTAKRILIIVPRQVDTFLEQSGVIFRHYLDKSHLREYEEKDLKKLAKNVGLRLTHCEKIHPLYNETIFLALFTGSVFLKKILRKLVFFILPKSKLPTEYFAVFEK
ncbi:class I SAM-dependent methyltransferase [Candidatus Daviesbacteria bacterium]|nr:class I SAM-dependent methyltransferase [Candidatus Daviesbacteria bacterium]